MASDLTQMWKNLLLTDSECVEWEAPAGECKDMVSKGQTCVIGKLFADHIVSKETIKNTLLRWGKLSETISFKILREINLFLLEFTNEDDKRRVLEERPWVF